MKKVPAKVIVLGRDCEKFLTDIMGLYVGYLACIYIFIIFFVFCLSFLNAWLCVLEIFQFEMSYFLLTCFLIVNNFGV